jgi:hypothetical protein
MPEQAVDPVCDSGHEPCDSIDNVGGDPFATGLIAGAPATVTLVEGFGMERQHGRARKAPPLKIA